MKLVLKRLLALAVSTTLALVFIEFALRWTIVPVEKLYHFEQGAVVSDPEIGYRLAPDQQTTMTNGHFVAEVRTNEHGLRDFYRDDYPDPGLIAIGDSQTFGHGLPAEETWVEQLQERLQANVINAGVFGYAVTQYETVLRRLHVEGYPIRTVLYAMTWNDLLSGRTPPDASTVVDGFVVGNPAYATQRQSRPFRERLRSSPIFEYATRSLALGSLVRSRVPGLLGSIRRDGPPPLDPALPAHAEQTRQVLLQLNEFLRSIGAKLVIVHIGNSNFVIPERWASCRLRYGYPRYFARDQLGPWAEAEGIGFADAIAPLESHYLDAGGKRTDLLLPVNDHYNAEANAVVAGLFFELLEIESAREEPSGRDSLR